MPLAQLIRLFLSWSHRDADLKADLLQRLEPNLACLAHVATAWWEDSQIEVGEDFRRDILRRIAECDYGLLLLSPSFLASRFIRDEELPNFVGGLAQKQALPVMLRPVPLDGSRNLRGLEKLQIFTLNGRAYSQLSGASRDDFASGLATEIQRRVLGAGWRAL